MGRPPNSFCNLDASELESESRQAIAAMYYSSAHAGKFHIIALIQNRSCSHLDSFAKSVITDSEGLQGDRPVIINMAYGRNGSHGAAIICNQAAYDHYHRHLEIADRSMHISKCELPICQLGSKTPKKCRIPMIPVATCCV